MKRKCVLFMHISLDGYATDMNDALDWIPYNEEIEKYADEIIADVGLPVYGRKTFELMRSFWPSMLDNHSVSLHEQNHAIWIENIQKVVISKTIKDPKWANTFVIKDNLVEEINKLKDEGGKNLVIFGSPSTAKEMLKLGLIDELLLTICPIILGNGKTIFDNNQQSFQLKLLKSQTFTTGIIATHYEILK